MLSYTQEKNAICTDFIQLKSDHTVTHIQLQYKPNILNKLINIIKKGICHLEGGMGGKHLQRDSSGAIHKPASNVCLFQRHQIYSWRKILF